MHYDRWTTCNCILAKQEDPRNSNLWISLYADDILFSAQNSVSSLWNDQVFNSFSSIAGYSVNWTKSTVWPINCNFQHTSPSLPQAGNIPYLGIDAMSKLSDQIYFNPISAHYQTFTMTPLPTGFTYVLKWINPSEIFSWDLPFISATIQHHDCTKSVNISHSVKA